MVSERITPESQPAAGEQPKKELAVKATAPQTIITAPHQTYLSQEQIGQLLTMVDRLRVQQVQGKSNMAAYDIRAHLNRIFGFGRWDGKVIEMSLIFEGQCMIGKGDSAKPGYEVAYKAGYELVVKAPAGNTLATYIEYAVGAQKMGVNNRGDVHDFAMKTAESQALKRAAINLGDQFGLSLYNKGSFGPLVGGTFLFPGRAEPEQLKGPSEQLHEETDPDIIIEDTDIIIEDTDTTPQQQQQAQAPQQQAPQQQPAPQAQAPAPQQQQAQQVPTGPFPEGSIEAGRADLQRDIGLLPTASKNRLMNLWGKTELPPLYRLSTEDQLATAWGLYGQCLPAAAAAQEQAPPASPPEPTRGPDDNNFYAAQA